MDGIDKARCIVEDNEDIPLLDAELNDTDFYLGILAVLAPRIKLQYGLL